MFMDSIPSFYLNPLQESGKGCHPSWRRMASLKGDANHNLL
jgi:hypothetical protein